MGFIYVIKLGDFYLEKYEQSDGSSHFTYSTSLDDAMHLNDREVGEMKERNVQFTSVVRLVEEKERLKKNAEDN